jgi:hypothetical protein
MRHHDDFIFRRRSQEALDITASWQASNDLRLYAGGGSLVHSDRRFKIAPWYVLWGFEVRVLGYRSTYHQLYGTPVFAIFCTNTQDHRWSIDSNFLLGYEWSKLQGIGRKLRLDVEYHNGYAPDGQWAKEQTNYTTLRFSYGF